MPSQNKTYPSNQQTSKTYVSQTQHDRSTVSQIMHPLTDAWLTQRNDIYDRVHISTNADTTTTRDESRRSQYYNRLTCSWPNCLRRSIYSKLRFGTPNQKYDERGRPCIKHKRLTRLALQVTSNILTMHGPTHGRTHTSLSSSDPCAKYDINACHMGIVLFDMGIVLFVAFSVAHEGGQ